VIRHNIVPAATFTSSCTFLVCSFDASGSTDSDGTIASYAWDFGDGTTDTGVTPPSHTYAQSGSYVVSLTVTDNDGGAGNTTRNISPSAVRTIAHVGSTAAQGNVSTPSGVVPSGTAGGDLLVMVLSVNNSAAAVSIAANSGVTGWTLADTAVSGSMASYVYTKSAAAADAGKTTRFTLDVAAKYTLTIAAYTGDMLAPQVLKASESIVEAGHTTPGVTAADGDWVLSYWGDKSSATTTYALPGGVTQRQLVCNTGSGRICSVLADSAGPVTAGANGGLTATADAASGNATMWTILLRQAS